MSSQRDQLVFITLAAVVIMVVLQFIHHAGIDLRYLRSGIGKGEVWRLYSGHFVHLNWWHLALNGVGFLLCLSLFPRLIEPLRLIISITLLTTIISAGLYFVYPSISWYVGFSGVLHGLFVLGALIHRDLFGWATLIIIAVKLAWELLVGPIPGSASGIGGDVISEAHLLGALGALLLAWPMRPLFR